MAFKFEKIDVWQEAFRLSNEIDKTAVNFPKHELFSLASQMKRAADSVVLNIAEGSTGQTSAEFKNFSISHFVQPLRLSPVFLWQKNVVMSARNNFGFCMSSMKFFAKG